MQDKILLGQGEDGWSIVDGILVYKGHIFLSAYSLLWQQLIADAHNVGHEGIQKTLHRLRASFHNPVLSKLVRDFVASCTVCQRNKTEHLHPAGLLQPLAVPTTIWADISMDFVLRSSEGAWQVCYSLSSGSFFEVRPLHYFGTSVYDQFCCSSIL